MSSCSHIGAVQKAAYLPLCFQPPINILQVSVLADTDALCVFEQKTNKPKTSKGKEDRPINLKNLPEPFVTSQRSWLTDPCVWWAFLLSAASTEWYFLYNTRPLSHFEILYETHIFHCMKYEITCTLLQTSQKRMMWNSQVNWGESSSCAPDWIL